MQNIRTPLLLALLVLAGPGLGCVMGQTTDGTSISEAQVGQIVVGSSTRDDVSRILGAPDEIIYSNLEHDPLFERAFRYHRTRRKTTFFTVIVFSTARADTNSDNVVVFFDDAGVVDDIGTRLDMDAPKFGTPWSKEG